MARIRSIKPEFWTNQQVVECSANARLLFIGLWNFSDDFGRHTFSLKQIKAEIFPADDISLSTIRGMIDELSKNELIRVYAVDGKQYLAITGWHHQRIDKPQPAKYPPPPPMSQERSTTIPGTIPPDTIGYDKIGKEGIGGERNARERASSVRFDEFWSRYPHKVGKQSARKAFDKIEKKEDVSIDFLMAALHRYVNKTDDRPWCNPETWLNQGRWDDQPAAQNPKGNGHGRRTDAPPNGGDLARQLADEVRQRELEIGIFRPANVVRGD